MMRMERSVRMRHFRRSAGWPAPLFLSHRNLKVGAPFRPVLPGRGFRSPGEKAHPGHIGLGGAPEIKHFIRTPTGCPALVAQRQGGLRRPGTPIEPEPTTIQSRLAGRKSLVLQLQISDKLNSLWDVVLRSLPWRSDYRDGSVSCCGRMG